jgi:hypothetical protein
MNQPATVKQTFTPERAPQRIAPITEPFSRSGTGASNGAVNVRIDPKITNALARASLERRINQQPTSLHREIVAEALAVWLKKHGYLD